MNKQEFKRGQEVLMVCTVISPEITSDGELIVGEKNFSREIWANLENIIVPPEKIKVPKFVAEHIEYLRGLNSPMRDLFSVSWIDSNELAQWFYNEPGADDMLARAWLDGYEVEQEKLYTVEIPNPNDPYWKYTILRKGDKRVYLAKVDSLDREFDTTYHLTESEIRKDFDWAWQAGFAKEVE